METLALNGEEEPHPLPRNVDPAAQIRIKIARLATR
jgi:hypothetical protein